MHFLRLSGLGCLCASSDGIFNTFCLMHRCGVCSGGLGPLPCSCWDGVVERRNQRVRLGRCFLLLILGCGNLQDYDAACVSPCVQMYTRRWQCTDPVSVCGTGKDDKARPVPPGRNQMEARAGSHRLSPLSCRSPPDLDWLPRQLTPCPACRSTSKKNGLIQRAGATKALRLTPKGASPRLKLCTDQLTILSA